LIFFMTNWFTVWPFDFFSGNLASFADIWYIFCRLCMCESVTHCEGPTHNQHIFLSHWARSPPQDWDPGCHELWICRIHVMLLHTWDVFIILVTVYYLFRTDRFYNFWCMF
jgi:hypothetical protein